MANSQYAARLYGPFVGEVSDWKERTDVAKDADAVRELMRAGLESRSEKHGQPGGRSSPPSHLANQARFTCAISALVLALLALNYLFLGLTAIVYIFLAGVAILEAPYSQDAIPIIALNRGTD